MNLETINARHVDLSIQGKNVKFLVLGKDTHFQLSQELRPMQKYGAFAKEDELTFLKSIRTQVGELTVVVLDNVSHFFELA